MLSTDQYCGENCKINRFERHRFQGFVMRFAIEIVQIVRVVGAILATWRFQIVHAYFIWVGSGTHHFICFAPLTTKQPLT